jgi:hypothetical protein
MIYVIAIFTFLGVVELVFVFLVLSNINNRIYEIVPPWEQDRAETILLLRGIQARQDEQVELYKIRRMLPTCRHNLHARTSSKTKLRSPMNYLSKYLWLAVGCAIGWYGVRYLTKGFAEWEK